MSIERDEGKNGSILITNGYILKTNSTVPLRCILNLEYEYMQFEFKKKEDISDSGGSHSFQTPSSPGCTTNQNNTLQCIASVVKVAGYEKVFN